MDQSFSKFHRLRSSEDFTYLRLDSDCAKSKSLRIYFKNSRLNCQHTRLGLSVSKKVGKAHERNRLKRIIRENFRMSTYKNIGLDVLVVISPRIFKLNKEENKIEQILLADLSKCFNYIFNKTINNYV